MDRALSRTELQAIRAALEAADHTCVALEAQAEAHDHAGATAAERGVEQLAAVIAARGELAELVHRALAIVDRRIEALNRLAVRHHAGEDEPGAGVYSHDAQRALEAFGLAEPECTHESVGVAGDGYECRRCGAVVAPLSGDERGV
jgi:hypothetical protein